MERSMKKAWAGYIKSLPKEKSTFKNTKAPKKKKKSKKDKKDKKKEDKKLKLPYFRSSTPPDSITISKRDEDGRPVDPVTIDGKLRTSQFLNSPYDYYGEEDDIPDYEFERRGLPVHDRRKDWQDDFNGFGEEEKKPKKKKKKGLMSSCVISVTSDCGINVSALCKHH